MEAIQCVESLEAVDAVSRIPAEFKDHTFYGYYDIWQYKAKFDKKLCPRCLFWQQTVYYVGTYLRALFPYHKIKDVNTIEVLDHPHCRCILTRITDPTLYIMVTRGMYE